MQLNNSKGFKLNKRYRHSTINSAYLRLFEKGELFVAFGSLNIWFILHELELTST